MSKEDYHVIENFLIEQINWEEDVLRRSIYCNFQ